jgi:hypothetical protein
MMTKAKRLELATALEAWAGLIEMGLEVPAAGLVMRQAAEVIRDDIEQITDLLGA